MQEDSSKKEKCAYVTLVMKGDSFVVNIILFLFFCECENNEDSGKIKKNGTYTERERERERERELTVFTSVSSYCLEEEKKFLSLCHPPFTTTAPFFVISLYFASFFLHSKPLVFIIITSFTDANVHLQHK